MSARSQLKDFHVLIPTRYGSTRLPAKILSDIAEKPMIQHVYERAMQSGAKSVVIATDDHRIADTVKNFGGTVCMTSEKHQSGTERLSEVIESMQYDPETVIVNVQGDEPLIPPALIAQAAQDVYDYPDAHMSTLCEPYDDTKNLFTPTVVKVVLDAKGYALYFSRAPIPWERDRFQSQPYPEKTMQPFYRHIGIYAYRAKFLRQYLSWEPCPLETIEYLEQLRVLWHGGRIHVAIAKEHAPIGVDIQADLDAIRKLMS